MGRGGIELCSGWRESGGNHVVHDLLCQYIRNLEHQNRWSLEVGYV